MAGNYNDLRTMVSTKKEPYGNYNNYRSATPTIATKSTTPTVSTSNSSSAERALIQKAGGTPTYTGSLNDKMYYTYPSTTRSSTTNGYNGMPSVLSGNVTNKTITPSYKGDLSKDTDTGSDNGDSDGGSSSKSSGGAYGAYMQLAAAQLAANQQRAAEAAKAMRAAAQGAYDRGMSNLQNAYNTRLQSLSDSLNSTRDQLGNALNYATGNINQDADRSLKQAYINQMMNLKNLGQQMTAQGLSGGATESTLAKLFNNYGNSRNSIEGTRADNLADANNTYNTNIASALQAYNSALADAEAQRMQYANSLENALANNQISAEENYQNALNSNNSSYLDALGTALDQMNKYEFTPSEVLNDITLANVIQNAYNADSNYNKAVNQGVANTGVTNSTLDQANANNYLAAILKSLYNV